MLAVIVAVPLLAAAFISWLLHLKRWERRFAFFVLSGAYYLFVSRPGSIEFQGRTLSYPAEPWMIGPGCLFLALGVMTVVYHYRFAQVRATATN